MIRSPLVWLWEAPSLADGGRWWEYLEREYPWIGRALMPPRWTVIAAINRGAR